MAKYAQAECRGCHQLLPKNLMREVSEQVVTGRSGSSFGFFGGTRRDAKGNESGSFSGSRWNTGRTYYAYRTVWYCEPCFQIRRRRRVQRMVGAAAVLVIGFLVVLGTANNSAPDGSTGAPTSTAANPVTPANTQTPATAVQAPASAEDTSASANPGTQASVLTPVAALPDATQSAQPSLDAVTGAPLTLAASSTSSETLPAPTGNVAVEKDAPASVQSQAPLSYPTDAMRNQEHGEVIIDASIAADGTVQSATVERSSGYRSLDAAAVSSVLRWRFNPAERDGKPVATSIRIPINFAQPALR